MLGLCRLWSWSWSWSRLALLLYCIVLYCSHVLVPQVPEWVLILAAVVVVVLVEVVVQMQ